MSASALEVGERIAEPSVVFAIPGSREAVPSARRAVFGLFSRIPAEARRVIELVLAELVSNAVLHGRGDQGLPITVRVHTSDRRMIAAVSDPGDGFAWSGRCREPDAPGGWGLVLVDRLADDWGIGRLDGRNTVWFEVALAEG